MDMIEISNENLTDKTMENIGHAIIKDCVITHSKWKNCGTLVFINCTGGFVRVNNGHPFFVGFSVEDCASVEVKHLS